MAKKQQFYYKWLSDENNENQYSTDGGPYDSVKEARVAAAEEVDRDNSFARLGVASVEALIGPSIPVRCSAEDVQAAAALLVEEVEAAVQSALECIDTADGGFYVVGSPQSRSELKTFFTRWCPKYVEADTVRLDPKQTKTYSIKIPKQKLDTDAENAQLERHDVALANLSSDLHHRLSVAGKAALTQLRQEMQQINVPAPRKRKTKV